MPGDWHYGIANSNPRAYRSSAGQGAASAVSDSALATLPIENDSSVDEVEYSTTRDRRLGMRSMRRHLSRTTHSYIVAAKHNPDPGQADVERGRASRHSNAGKGHHAVTDGLGARCRSHLATGKTHVTLCLRQVKAQWCCPMPECSRGYMKPTDVDGMDEATIYHRAGK